MEEWAGDAGYPHKVIWKLTTSCAASTQGCRQSVSSIKTLFYNWLLSPLDAPKQQQLVWEKICKNRWFFPERGSTISLRISEQELQNWHNTRSEHPSEFSCWSTIFKKASKRTQIARKLHFYCNWEINLTSYQKWKPMWYHCTAYELLMFTIFFLPIRYSRRFLLTSCLTS
jgi:hypothetical protein